MINKIITTLLQLALIVFLAFVAKEAWIAYEQEKLNVLFGKESKLVNIRVGKVTHEKKTWKDYIGNSKYLGFTYNGKLYSIRYLQKGAWVGEGSNIPLQYHPELDLFRQPGIVYHKLPNKKLSKLIQWTIVGTFSYANRWLSGFVALSVIILLLLFSILANIKGLAFFSTLSNWFVIVCFLGASVFFTWDSWANYEYYRQLKINGKATMVLIADKNRVSYDPENNADNTPFYYCTATVNFNSEVREIMISSNDYNRLSPREQFTVLYNASIDDMMSVDYSPGYWRVFFVALLWSIVVYILKKKKWLKQSD